MRRSLDPILGLSFCVYVSLSLRTMVLPLYSQPLMLTNMSVVWGRMFQEETEEG